MRAARFDECTDLPATARRIRPFVPPTARIARPGLPAAVSLIGLSTARTRTVLRALEHYCR
jgi:hypothetical protein